MQNAQDFYLTTKITKCTKTDCVSESSSVLSVLYVVKSIFSHAMSQRPPRKKECLTEAQRHGDDFYKLSNP